MEFILNSFSPIRDSKGQETSFVITRNGAIDSIKKRTDYQSHVVSVVSGMGGSQKGSIQLAELGIVFDGFPKPIELIRYFIRMITGNDYISLDFFAGSGVLAHAAMLQNASDYGARQHIIVQLPEQLSADKESQKRVVEWCDSLGKPRTIAELTKERLRRAGAKIRAENPMFAGDVGFRVFKLASSNIRAWNPDQDDLEQSLQTSIDHIISDRTEQDILFEVLLKLGLELTIPIEERQVAGHRVHSIGAGVLLVCLSPLIPREAAEPLALGLVAWHREQAPVGEVQLVFRDSAFVDDVTKTNLTAILQQHGLHSVRSL